MHRFQINALLGRDGVVQDPMVLPVSPLITSGAAERSAYDQLLNTISRPLIKPCIWESVVQAVARASDGMPHAGVWRANDESLPDWRHISDRPVRPELVEGLLGRSALA